MRKLIVVCALVFTLTPLFRPSSLAAESTEPPREESSAALLQTILAVLPSDHSQYGIVVKNLVTGETAMLNPDTVFVSASLYKLSVMYEAYRQRQSGTFPFDARVRSQLRASITWSDNDSAWALFGRLGIGRINATMREIGLPNTLIGDPTTTTAREMARLFELIYRGEAVDAESSREMLDLLKEQQIRDRLPLLLPPGTVVAHKTGNLGAAVHDAGIVYAPSGPYIIVVLTGRSHYQSQASYTIANLSRSVYLYFEDARPSVGTGLPPGALQPFRPAPSPSSTALESSAADTEVEPYSALIRSLEQEGMEARYFPETGHYVVGPFLEFFDRHGQLEIFGYPLTEAFEEHGLLVQYFQRQRLEWWPENPDPYKVLPTLIGDEVMGPGMPPLPSDLIPSPNDPDWRYFPETGHAVSHAFLQYFDRHGGLAVFGYPTSEPYEEAGLTVQRFQRGRMEWHPNNPELYRVQLTLLGYQLAEQRGVTEEQLQPRPGPDS